MKMQEYSKAYIKEAIEIALGEVDIHQCRHCGHPVIDGHFCRHCKSDDPKAVGQELSQL